MKAFVVLVFAFLIFRAPLAAALHPKRALHRSLRFLNKCWGHHPSSIDSLSNSNLQFSDIVKGGQAELLLAKPNLASYFDKEPQNEAAKKLLQLADECRQSYLTTGIAHIPNFIRQQVVAQMVQEAVRLAEREESFYSTEKHTVYQEPPDPNFSQDHPRNALQQSSKWIIDFDRIPHDESPLYILYKSPAFQAFVSYVVRPPKTIDSEKAQLYESGCDYNAAYYNIYNAQDGLGWHFDRSDFGVNLELQPAKHGGEFELAWNTRPAIGEWCFDKVQSILDGYTSTHRIRNPPVGPGSLVIFAGSRNLHRVTPVSSSKPRINAIMTYETKPHQTPNAYSLRKFFGR